MVDKANQRSHAEAAAKAAGAPDGSVTLGMAEAGGRALAICLTDETLLGKPNMAGEIALRVYRAMSVLDANHSRTSTQQVR